MASWIALRFTLLLTLGAEVEQRLAWDAAEGCPSAAAVLEATTRYLGHPLADYPRAVNAQARVERSVGGFRLQLTLEVDGLRERHEQLAPDCDRLGRDVALLIATAVDPFAQGPRQPEHRQLLVPPVVVQYPRRRPPTRASTTPLSPTPEAPPEAPRAVEPGPALDSSVTGIGTEPPERRARPPIMGTLGLAGTSFAGLFPQIGGGLMLDGGIERRAFRWQAGASGWFGGRFRGASGDVGANLWAAAGSTGFCWAPSVGRARFAACAVAGIGAITATSVNTQTTRTLARPWAFVGPDLRATWTPRPRLGVFLGVSVLPALIRPGWSVSDPDASFRTPPVAGLVRLGLELRELGPR